jgi:hypothetical protein
MENINIATIIGGNIAVSTSDGETVFSELSKHLKEKETISLDFENISILTTAFLNAAIGQLYSGKTYPNNFLNEHLKIINRAKEYYQNKKNLEESVNTVFHG